MSEKHTVRDGIIAGTVAAVLGSLLLEPVREGLVAGWHVVAGVAGAVWHGLTASVPIPVWVLLLVAVAIVAFVARRVRRMAAPAKPTIKAYDTTTGTYGPPPVEEPAASALRIHSTTVEPGTPALAGRDTAALTDLEDKIIRIMGREDGSPLRIGELAEMTGATRLRVEQAIEGLEGRHGLVRRLRTYMDGTSYVLTTQGRDLVIERGDA